MRRVVVTAPVAADDDHRVRVSQQRLPQGLLHFVSRYVQDLNPAPLGGEDSVQSGHHLLRPQFHQRSGFPVQDHSQLSAFLRNHPTL